MTIPALLIMTVAAYGGLALAIWWDRITIKHNWKGWHLD